MGTHTEEGKPSRHWYFGTRISPGPDMADGRFFYQRIDLQSPAERSITLYQATIVLRAGRKRGSFTAPIGGPGTSKIWGTFTCG